MKIKIWMLALLAACGFGCAENTRQPAAGQHEKSDAAAGPGFAFSTQAMVTGNDPANSWCRTPFSEAAVVNADPANFNRRLFTLSDGPTKVFVESGKFTAAFILKKNGKTVDIFTSDNLPECLSNRVNFSIGADRTTFRYNNNRYIDFEIQLVPLPNGTQIALEMAPGAGYGIEVRR
jgi:hypothetical protein